MNDEAPARDAWEVYAESLEYLVSSTEPLLGPAEDAFRAGYEAGQQNRLDRLAPLDHECGERRSPGLATRR